MELQIPFYGMQIAGLPRYPVRTVEWGEGGKRVCQGFMRTCEGENDGETGNNSGRRVLDAFTAPVSGIAAVAWVCSAYAVNGRAAWNNQSSSPGL